MQLEAILVAVLMSAALLWLAASLRRGRRLALPAVVLASGLAVWAAYLHPVDSGPGGRG